MGEEVVAFLTENDKKDDSSANSNRPFSGAISN
jgi:hypothetical protein